MINQNKEFDQILDLFAVRIIVDSVKDCYAALGIIHEKYKPIQGRFKDYIAMPKPNMYQSLHTTLIAPGNGEPFEIQIRTYEMHRTAEYGIAAHWKYKENIDGTKGGNNEEAKLAWLRQILEWQRDMSDNKEFLSTIKSDLDLFSDAVFCFTPNGEVKNLPTGSTPIDFAYSIVGSWCSPSLSEPTIAIAPTQMTNVLVTNPSTNRLLSPDFANFLSFSPIDSSLRSMSMSVPTKVPSTSEIISIIVPSVEILPS